MEHKLIQNKQPSEIFIDFIKLYLHEEDIDNTLDSLMKNYMLLDIDIQLFLRKMLSFPFSLPKTNFFEENRYYIDKLLLIDSSKIDYIWNKFTYKIQHQKYIFINSKLLLYLYIYSNKEKPGIMYTISNENIFIEMVKMNLLEHDSEFLAFITDLICLRNNSFLKPGIHYLIAFLVSDTKILTCLFEKLTNDKDLDSLNCLYERIYYHFFGACFKTTPNLLLKPRIIEDLKYYKKYSSQVFDVKTKMEESFKIFCKDNDIEENFIKRYLNEEYKFFNEFLVVSRIRYNQLKISDYHDEKIRFIYNFIQNHKYVYDNLNLDLKCDIDSILKFINKENVLNFNMINLFLKDNNNILSFTYKFHNKKDLVINYEVLDLIYTLNLFEYFEKNIEKTPKIYIYENRFILVDVLLTDIIEKILNQKLSTLELIYSYHFIIFILRSIDYFDKIHSKVLQLFKLEFVSAFIKTPLIDDLKFAILFHNFMSMYIIACKSLDRSPQLIFIQKFIYEQSYPLLEKLFISDFPHIQIKNYLNSILNILVNIVELDILKCFNLICVRCMKTEIDENYLLYQDDNVFNCRSCSHVNLFEYIKGAEFEIDVYLEFINANMVYIENFLKGLNSIIGKYKVKEIELIFYKKLAEFLKYLNIYSNCYDLSSTVYDIYLKLCDQIQSFISSNNEIRSSEFPFFYRD